MKKCFWLLCIFMVIPTFIFAVVPTTDIAQLTQDVAAVQDYLQTLRSLTHNFARTADIAAQKANLQKLIDTQQQITKICGRVCDKEGQKQLHHYLENINDNITSQFNQVTTTLTGIDTTVSNIQEVVDTMVNLGKDVVGGPKRLSLALQQAMLQSQQFMQETETQIQILTFQQSQKQLAEQQLEKATTDSTYAGFANAGL